MSGEGQEWPNIVNLSKERSRGRCGFYTKLMLMGIGISNLVCLCLSMWINES